MCVSYRTARGLHALLPPIEVVEGSICNSDPEEPGSWEDGLFEKVQRNADGSVKTRILESPFVQVPLGVTEDRLVGTVDIEASMKEAGQYFIAALVQGYTGYLQYDVHGGQGGSMVLPPTR
jgi:magnesium chelatase subunit D